MEIESLGARGDGIAQTEAGEAFVPLTLPGERVAARLAGARGTLEAVLRASPDRAMPPCRHFGDCGGCALQHAAPGFCRAWKRDLVVSALARAGLRDAPVGDMIEAPAASRRRATFAVVRAGEGAMLGFNARAETRIVAVEQCEVLAPRLLAALPGLRAFAATMPAAWRAFDLAATLCENGIDVDFAPPPRAETPQGQRLSALAEAMRAAGIVRCSFGGEPALTLAPPIVRFGAVAVTPPAGGFLQASAEGEAMLSRLVLDAASGSKRAVDLFCGSGAFSFPLAEGMSVKGFDADRGAVAAFNEAARHAGGRPVSAEVRNLFERPLTAEDLRDYDVAVFDPPRAGASAQAEQLAKSRLKRVIAVSCNPATFARDAALLAAGGLTLAAVTPVDQFVYAAHVELVAVFSRR